MNMYDKEGFSFPMRNSLSWIRDEFDLGYCITFAWGVNEQELLRRFGGDPSHAWPIPFGQLFALQELEDEEYKWLEAHEFYSKPIIQIGQCGDWAFAIESNGTIEGSRPEVLQAVSVDTVALSLTYISEKALAIFSYAEHGIVVATFDPLVDLPYGEDHSEILPSGDDPLRMLPLIQKVDVEDEDYEKIMYDLAEVIGVRLDREALTKPLLTGEIIPLPSIS